jgi:hypothetical protein
MSPIRFTMSKLTVSFLQISEEILARPWDESDLAAIGMSRYTRLTN